MYKFMGQPGEYIAGVPARDLSDKEAKEHGVEASPLYEKKATKPDPQSDEGSAREEGG